MKAVEIAARTAWGEARGEGVAGMQAVLNVINNRAKSPGWWGRDIASVCLTPWQFSCWNAVDPNRERLTSVTDKDALYRSAVAMAGRMAAGSLPDLTKGADSYYATDIPKPGWAVGRVPLITIGHHAFYRMGLRGNGE